MTHLSSHYWLVLGSLIALVVGTVGMCYGITRMITDKHRAPRYDGAPDPFDPDIDYDGDGDEPPATIDPADEPVDPEDEQWMYDIHRINQERVATELDMNIDAEHLAEMHDRREHPERYSASPEWYRRQEALRFQFLEGIRHDEYVTEWELAA
jgi:hypothetical protein